MAIVAEENMKYGIIGSIIISLVLSCWSVHIVSSPTPTVPINNISQFINNSSKSPKLPYHSYPPPSIFTPHILIQTSDPFFSITLSLFLHHSDKYFFFFSFHSLFFLFQVIRILSLSNLIFFFFGNLSNMNILDLPTDVLLFFFFL